MIALPPHDPCGREGLGEIDPATGAATCKVRRTWPGWKAHDVPGCGQVFTLCIHGQRACAGCKLTGKAAA